MPRLVSTNRTLRRVKLFYCTGMSMCIIIVIIIIIIIITTVIIITIIIIIIIIIIITIIIIIIIIIITIILIIIIIINASANNIVGPKGGSRLKARLRPDADGWAATKMRCVRQQPLLLKSLQNMTSPELLWYYYYKRLLFYYYYDCYY
jgi:amino acid transporter